MDCNKRSNIHVTGVPEEMREWIKKVFQVSNLIQLLSTTGFKGPNGRESEHFAQGLKDQY